MVNINLLKYVHFDTYEEKKSLLTNFNGEVRTYVKTVLSFT